MDTSSYEDQMANFSDLFKKSALPILIVSALLTVGLGLHLITSPPEFWTDLNDFAPSSDSNDAHDRIHEYFPDESRPLFIHVTKSNDGNVLSIDSLKDMKKDLETLQADERINLVAVDSWTTSPGMIQIALDEQSPDTTLSDYENWAQLVDAIVDDDTGCDDLNPDDALLSTVNFVGYALVNKNLDISATCNYLSSGEGDAVPTAASTAWVLEIDPEMPED